MNELAGYTAEQALDRDLLVRAVNGASLRWARVHGYTADGPLEQVLAKAIHLGTRGVWSVDLDDIDRAVTVLIDQPLTYARPDRISDPLLLTLVSSAFAAARDQAVTTVDAIPGVAGGVADYDPEAFDQLVVDVVFQIAALGQVIR
jgi:hypothetical protein